MSILKKSSAGLSCFRRHQTAPLGSLAWCSLVEAEVGLVFIACGWLHFLLASQSIYL